MNIIFMGTPEFAVPVLQALLDCAEHKVTAVITQPDKARGRSGKPVYTPVKQLAVEHGISVLTPGRVRDTAFVKELSGIPCDVIVVVAFGQILPREILEMPRYGCINVHASLLPRWRGAAPMQWSIMSGDAKTGLTTMKMDEGLDTGDMLLRREVVLSPEETGESLHDKLSALGGEPLLEASVVPGETGAEPGEVVSVDKESFTVQAGQGALRILRLQLEGKKKMDTASFLRGVTVEKGERLQ